MSQMLVGVDVSLRSHHVHFMNADGVTLADFSVSNDRIGADTLIKRMLETAEKKSVCTVENRDGINRPVCLAHCPLSPRSVKRI